MTEPLSDDGDLLAALRDVWDQVDPVPEPASLGLFGIAACGLATRRRRRCL